MPVLVLLLALAAKYAVIFTCPVSDEFQGDEQDYLHKARVVWRTGGLPRARETGQEELSYTDFRPPGYALLVAPLLVFGEDARQIHLTLRVVQSALDIALSALLFGLCIQMGRSRAYQVGVAFVLGVQPWTCAWVTSGYTETTVNLLVVLGVLALSRAVLAERPGNCSVWLLTGSALLSGTFLLRPEMIAFVPAIVALALALRRRGWGSFLGFGALAALPFGLCVLALIAHRLHVADEVRIFGSFRHATPGLRKWSCTWCASVYRKSDVVWGMRRGRDVFPLIPDCAFDNEEERARVNAIAERIHRAGRMTAADDADFMALARERIRHDPWRYYLWVRIFESVHLWVNLDTSTAYLEFFSRLPRTASRAAVGAFLALRLGVLALAAVGSLCLVRRWRSARDTSIGVFLLLGLFFAVTRTLFFGFVSIIAESRYVTPAWPFVIFLATFGASCMLRMCASSHARPTGPPPRPKLSPL